MSEQLFSVRVNLTGPALWKVTTAAETAGVTVPEFMASLAGSVKAPGRRTSTARVIAQDGEIERLNGGGLLDSEIAQRLGLGVATVQRRRRRLGLPANGHRPTGELLELRRRGHLIAPKISAQPGQGGRNNHE